MRSHFALLLGPHELLHAAHHACEAAGHLCVCDNATDNWPVEKAVDYLLALLAAHANANPNRRVAVLCDGELSSPVTGDGIGGRNSAFVLACVAKIAGKKITVLSAGTDGIDGNSSAAGAVADGETLGRARDAGLDPADFLRRSDSYSFFARLGDAIVTGPTGNNLRDLRILLAEPDARTIVISGAGWAFSRRMRELDIGADGHGQLTFAQQIFQRCDRVCIAARGERENGCDPHVEVGLVQIGNQHARDVFVRFVEFRDRSDRCLRGCRSAFRPPTIPSRLGRREYLRACRKRAAMPRECVSSGESDFTAAASISKAFGA